MAVRSVTPRCGREISNQASRPRVGEVLEFPVEGQETYKARIVDPVFYDKEGSRANG